MLMKICRTIGSNVYQSKQAWEQSREEPHHFCSFSGGHGLPPRREWVNTRRLRVDSPMPHDLLQADHAAHSLTTQCRGPAVIAKVWSLTCDFSLPLCLDFFSSIIANVTTCEKNISPFKNIKRHQAIYYRYLILS